MFDPGIGFSKTAEQNAILLFHLPQFRNLGRPLLVGPSRKSFIGRLLPHAPPPAERVWGTAAAVTACVLAGADVVRVHDVTEMRQVTAVADGLCHWGAPDRRGPGPAAFDRER
jgi:dihydropteroate synthase